MMTLHRFRELVDFLGSSEHGYSFQWRWKTIDMEEQGDFVELCAKYTGILGKLRLLRDVWREKKAFRP